MAGDQPEATGLLRELFEAADVGMAVLDRDLRYVSINRCLAELNGLPAADHLGRSIDEVVPRIAEVLRPILRSVLDTGEPVSNTELLGDAPAHPGIARTWSGSFWPLRSGDRIVGVGAMILDQTGARNVERELRKSEAQFRAICEASPVGIFLCAPGGANVYANAASLAQLGVSFDEALGAGWERAVHPDDLPQVRASFYQAVERSEPYRGKLRYLHRDGTVVLVDVVTTGIYDGDTLLGHVGVSEDITERALAESAHRESELRFRQLAENIGSVFWLSDATRKVLYYVSPAFESIWGLRVEDMMRDYGVFDQAIHPEDRERVLAILRQPVLAPYEHEFRIVRPDGAIAWIADRCFPVRDESGRIVRLAGIATDVTMQKAMEARVLQAQKLDSIGRIAGGIAHDFNNLLTVVLNQVSMAIRASDQGRAPRDELDQIQEAARQATEVTRQLLAFGRRQALVPAILDPNELVDAAGRFLRRLLGASIELVLGLQGDVGVIRGDRAQLEQVLLNLALNARDAMEEGGKLTIRTRNALVDGKAAGDAPVPPGAWVVLSVEDTGRGIADADLPHIFEPFFSTKPAGDGTGLGLATCYGTVKQHGGHVLVDSTSGQGSTFTLYFPRIDVTVAGASMARDPAPAARKMQTILVVEDEPSVRTTAVRALAAHGFDVLEATNGLDALRVLDEHAAVDLVFTDLVMPSLGGAELGAMLRAKRPALPVLYTSGRTQPCRLVGDDGAPLPFLAKPYLTSMLVQSVRDALDARA